MPRASTRPTTASTKRRGQHRKAGGGGGETNAQHVYRHVPIIQVLGKMHKAGEKKLQHRLLELSPDTVRAMGNISLNALNDRIPMTPAQKRLFQAKLPHLQKLAAGKGSVAAKRKVVQEGGLAPILAFLAPLAMKMILGRVFRSNNE